MSKQKPRVCIIGAGPSGMSVMYQIKQLYPDKVDFECYEKQATWCGQWNYTWRTGKYSIRKIYNLSENIQINKHVKATCLQMSKPKKMY
jgi:cation diffusion facilitator CzcD-associated flavoprotein CzcO